MCFFLNDGVSMLNRMLIKAIVGFSIACASLTTFAASIEGYWKSIDDRTGEQLSIYEIKKGADGTFHGKILYRYPVPGGVALTHCTKCPPPYTNKPLVGMETFLGFKQDEKNPNLYMDGRLLEPKSGKIYKGKATVTADGKRMRLRGYVGISALGRTQVWIRTDNPNP